MEKYIHKPIIVDAIQFSDVMREKFLSLHNPRENPIEVFIEGIEGPKFYWNWHLKRLEMQTEDEWFVIEPMAFIFKRDNESFWTMSEPDFNQLYKKLEQ